MISEIKIAYDIPIEDRSRELEDRANEIFADIENWVIIQLKRRLPKAVFATVKRDGATTEI